MSQNGPVSTLQKNWVSLSGLSLEINFRPLCKYLMEPDYKSKLRWCNIHHLPCLPFNIVQLKVLDLTNLPLSLYILRSQLSLSTTSVASSTANLNSKLISISSRSSSTYCCSTRTQMIISQFSISNPVSNQWSCNGVIILICNMVAAFSVGGSINGGVGCGVCGWREKLRI